MQKVVLTRGLPASGKSTWAKTLVSEKNSNWKRINKDDLRLMVNDGVYSKENEHMVVAARDAMIRTFLTAGHSVIVDDTNIQDVHIKSIFHIVSCEFPHVEFEVVDFDVDVKECIKRDKLREGSKHVGKGVIHGMYSQYSKIDKEAWKALPRASVEPQVNNFELHTVVIVDIDGTVAKMGDRSPFDWGAVGKDKPNTPVVRIIKSLIRDGHEIIFMSGRSEESRDETVKWLDRHGMGDYAGLYMRAENDMRKDYIVKRELYEAHIRGKYNVLGVFDDRDQVVHMWRRQLGLPVFQVDYGNF